MVLTKSPQDRTIIGVAVPAISNDFGSFNDIAWYESAYLLTFAALQLPMGKIYVRPPPIFAVKLQFLRQLLTMISTDILSRKMGLQHLRCHIRNRINRMRRSTK